MRTLFNLQSPREYGILNSAYWPYVRDGLRRNLQAIVRYHRRNPTAVQSSHFLVRLLGAIAIPHSLNLERYFDNVDSSTFNVASTLKMTTTVARGHMFRGIFYGPESHEVLIGHNGSFDPYEVDLHWMSQSPVTVLRHPRSDLTMMLPDGSDTSSEGGIAVIMINIPMLAIMYRAFRRYEDVTSVGGSALSVMHFIRMYVLPNMLPSHLDVALFNRIDNLQKGAPMGESRKSHSFALPDYSDKVNRVQKEVLTYIQKKRQDLLAVLKTVPAANAGNMADALDVPDIAPTRQVVWALVLARLNVLAFLVSVGRDRATTMNQSELNAMRRAITSYHSDNVFSNVLPPEDYYETQLQLDLIYDSGTK